LTHVDPQGDPNDNIQSPPVINRNQHANHSDGASQDYLFSMEEPTGELSFDSADQTSNNFVFSSSSDDLPDSEESDPHFQSDSWEDLQQQSGNATQLASSADTTSSTWSCKDD
jgi:hypothetical protein